MTAQEANYFTRLAQDTDNYREALQELNNRLQEGKDRGYDQTAGSIVFDGDLDHLSAAKVGALFNAMTAVNSTMEASSRAAWSAVYGVIR